MLLGPPDTAPTASTPARRAAAVVFTGPRWPLLHRWRSSTYPRSPGARRRRPADACSTCAGGWPARPAARTTTRGTSRAPSFVDLDTRAVRSARPRRPSPAARPGGARRRRCARAGVRTGHPVVVYDAGDGQAAARAVVDPALGRATTTVRVLDGGFAAWVAAGRPVDPGEAATPPTATSSYGPGGLPVLDADAAAALAARRACCSTPGSRPRYRGEIEPVDPVAGHIPGAVNLPAARLADRTGACARRTNCGELFAARACGRGAGRRVLRLRRHRRAHRAGPAPRPGVPTRRSTSARGASGSPTPAGRSPRWKDDGHEHAGRLGRRPARVRPRRPPARPGAGGADHGAGPRARRARPTRRRAWSRRSRPTTRR